MIRPVTITAALMLLWACSDPTGTATSPGPVAFLQITAGDLQADTVGHELDAALVVRVTDSAGVAVSGQIINFRVTAGAGSVFAGAAISDDAGEARERWTLGPLAGDTQRLQARAVDTRTGAAIVFREFKAVGVADVAASVHIVPSGGADSALFVGGDTILTADALQLTAIAVDRFGNVKGDPAVTWSSTSGLIASVSATGLVQAHVAGNTIIRAQVDTAAGQRPLSVSARLPVGLILLSAPAVRDTIEALVPDSLRVLVVDRRGAPFEGVPVTFRGVNAVPLDTAAGCSCRTVSTGPDGQAASAWRLGSSAGQAVLRAVLAVDSAGRPAVVLAGNAASLVKVSGGSTNAGLVVAVRDRLGNPVRGTAVAWSVSGSGQLSDTTSTSDDNGLAGTLVLSPATGAIVTATVPGLAGSPVTFVVDPVAGFSLDFRQSYVSVADAPALDLADEWTLEAWIQPRSAVTVGQQDIISKWNGAGDASYQLQLDTDGRLRAVTHDGLSNSIVRGNQLVPLGVWTHVALTFSQGTARLYVNGTLDATITGVLRPMDSSQQLAFGREGNYSGHTFDGRIDEIRVWSLVRTEAQIAAARSVRLSGAEPGLVGYWQFDEGSGDVAFDATGGGHHGRLGNTTGSDAWDPRWSAIIPFIP